MPKDIPLRTLPTVLVLIAALVPLKPGADRIAVAAAGAQAGGVRARAFSGTGNLVGPRTDHTATLLADGKVLIAGGNNGVGNLDTAEVYDPGTGKFTSVDPMSQTRSGHTATLLPNGKVLIAGGISSGVVNTAIVYDPVLATFTSTGAMNAARANHTATLLPDGRVLMAGGIGAGSTQLNTTELFDYVNEIFVPGGSLAASREHHTATLLANGKVLVAGGYDGVTTINGAEVYDPASDTSTPTSAPLNLTRFRHTATRLPNGMVLVAGGAVTLLGLSTTTAELYNPATNTFVPTTPMNVLRQQHTATVLPSGRVLIAGGAGNGAMNSPLDSAEIYDPTGATFTPADSLGAARWHHTATLLANGTVLLAAGENPAALNSAERYDPANGSFASAGTMVTARSNAASSLLLNGKVLIAGGQDGTNAVVNTAELYDSATGFTATVAPMNSARWKQTATLLRNGKVLITGGHDGFATLNTAELFDPAAGSNGTFTLTGNMTTPREYHTATLLGDGRVLITGGSNGLSDLNTLEMYDPATGVFTAISATMSAPRAKHTATLVLPNVEVVLLAGGVAGNGALNTAEYYNTYYNTFYPAGTTMVTGRFGHTATLLGFGKVLLAGGSTQVSPPGTTQTAEIFDLVSIFQGGFVATGPMSVPRQGHTATLLGNGKVLISGGTSDSNQNWAELYDPGAATFANTGTFSARSHHQATLLLNGKVLIAGGDSFGSQLNTADLYDVGLGYPDSRRPIITSAPPLVSYYNPITVGGTGFVGDSEASGGSGNSSATNYPLVQLQRVDNGEIAVLSPDFPWSDTSVTASRKQNTSLPTLGPYRLTITTNGVPSVQRLLVMQPFGPPSNLSATATGATQVTTSWDYVDIANVTDYEIFRGTSLSGPFTLVGSTHFTNTMTDTGLSPNTVYVYKVRAISGGVTTEFSAPDPASTFAFTDPTLTAGATIKAAHMNELRAAITAMRAAAELPAFGFATPLPGGGIPVLRQHLVDLRKALGEARSTFRLPAIAYTDPVVTAGSTAIKAVHITQLRAVVMQ